MVDIVPREARSRMMSGIRGRNTRPEIIIRRLLFAKGFRFRLHRRDLPGVPDIVLTKHRTVIFVHGCFWHVHEGCKYFKLPASNPEFWRAKLFANRERDDRNIRLLLDAGWRVLVIWECAIRNDSELSILPDIILSWITSGEPFVQLPVQPGEYPVHRHRKGRKSRS